MKIKKILALAVALTSVFAVAGCGSTGDSSSKVSTVKKVKVEDTQEIDAIPDEAQKTIRWMGTYDLNPDEKKGEDKSVEMTLFNNKGGKVEYTRVTDSEKFDQLASAIMAQQNVPDIFRESSADVRIAQYESGQRTPKQETLIRIAEILEVDVRNFLSPGIATMDELMETLFWMDEENRGLFHLFLLNDSESETVGITIRDKKTMSYLQEWMGKKQKLGDGRITEEEYLEWKLHWPENKRKTEYKTV